MPTRGLSLLSCAFGIPSTTDFERTARLLFLSVSGRNHDDTLLVIEEFAPAFIDGFHSDVVDVLFNFFTVDR